MPESNPNATIVGAGLVGSLLALYLAKKGNKVTIFERRPDMRKADIGGGRSINLALSDRGWRALEGIGIGDDIRKVGIPMDKRIMHDVKGNLTSQPYGKEGQAIYSVSRGGLNMKLMDLAEENPNISLQFNQQLTNLDLKTNTLEFHNPQTNQDTWVQAERIFGADGAFSAVRNTLQKTERFEYSQSFLEYGYKELTIAPGENGTWQLEKNALHIWPRGQYMMIALPNLDGSFTCTMFFPYEGEHSFSALKTEADVTRFFGEVFPDAVPLMPTLLEDYFGNPTGTLVTVKCFPWTFEDKVALIGDAAHAVVPFYGQGMNAGFEDCTVLNQLMEAHGNDWETIFKAFEKSRKPNADAIADLAVMNFVEMRDKVADPQFLLQKKIEAKINAMYPEQWIPLYTMVTFSPDIPYAKALKNGRKQERIMKKLMPYIQTEADFEKPEVQEILQQKMAEKFSV
ncbi:FAD-dependent monooxygenase [Adhaeribacter sp. BT258]|uniref:Kynurenine 3-monooxygenase n=1 Tax=Adhaeribacter terrigena TaxID=2793070 RepID=A0ABS1C4X6_9BACT|nr:NAD(P)/FAD-dependent oxidoreductase [Adhaeribacter terrigena]MBK0404227.1 FAD-dependent monooxygenase [Adhaeribacter terrigena]